MKYIQFSKIKQLRYDKLTSINKWETINVIILYLILSFLFKGYK